jgi:uncharacterized protein (TIGR02001 family)
MRTAFLVAIAYFVCMSAARTARAADEPGYVYGNLQLMSNYIFAGLSQSVGKPALQVEIDVNPGRGFYGNFSAVNVGWIQALYPADSARVELDGLIGFRQPFGGGGLFKAGVLRLEYPGHYVLQSPPSLRPDTTELFGYVGWSGVSAKLSYTVTEAFGTPGSRGSWYLDTNALLPIGARWTLGAHAGHKQSRGTNPLTGADNARLYTYDDYKLSATRLLGASCSLTLALSGTTTDRSIYTIDGYYLGGRQLALTFEQDF